MSKIQHFPTFLAARLVQASSASLLTGGCQGFLRGLFTLAPSAPAGRPFQGAPVSLKVEAPASRPGLTGPSLSLLCSLPLRSSHTAPRLLPAQTDRRAPAPVPCA